MYWFKLNQEQKDKLLGGRNITYCAKQIGMGRSYLSAILNQWRGCSKFCAYCITKYFDNNKEVNDFFEIR